MALFALGSDLQVQRDVLAAPTRAYALSRELLLGYQARGYRVELDETDPPRALRAAISNPQGTALQAAVQLDRREPQRVAVRVHLSGVVHVGGMQAMLATEGLVRAEARKRLVGFMERVFGDVQPEPVPAPAPAPAPAPPAALETKLAQLKTLHERGLISAEDLQRKRRELLDAL